MLHADEMGMTPAAMAAFNNFMYMLDRDGSDAIEKQELAEVLNTLAWKGDIDDLWSDFAKQCKSANTGVAYDEVDVRGCIAIDKEELKALYSSLGYHTEQVASRAAENIIAQLKQLFDSIDNDGSGIVSGDEVREMAATLSKKFNMKVEPDQLVAKLDRNGDNEITFAELAAGVLSLDLPDDDPQEFDEKLIDPEEHTASEFLTGLKEFSNLHRASNHPFLKDMAGGRFPDIKRAILTYATEYRKYSSTFTAMLQLCHSKLDDEFAAKVIKENLEEELGDEALSASDAAMLAKLGIPKDTVQGVPHKVLFDEFTEAIRSTVKGGEAYAPPAQSPGAHFGSVIKAACDASAHTGLAVLSFAAELLVPTMYEYIFRAITLHTKLTPVQSRFFPIHISCDGGHFEKLSKAMHPFCNVHADTTPTKRATKKMRAEIYHAVAAALDARAVMWDELRTMCSEVKVADGKEVASSLYDKQATNWVRDKPNCLSDFTGRPRLFEACGDVRGKHMLDVGCGEGYCARVLRKAGVRKVVGVDVSEGMVAAASASERSERLGNMYYLAADALEIKQALCDNAPSVGMLGGAEIERGCFDLAIAAFLFNYVSTKSMAKIMEQVYDLLLPGGAFVFSVPHPMMAGKKANASPGDGGTFGFESEEYTGYFSSRDELLPGVISTRDGKKLNVRMIHKTFEDYMTALGDAGFQLESLKECAVTEEHLKLDPAFFGPVSDMPLHAVFRCVRPLSTTHSARNLNNLTMLPRQLLWTPIELKNPSDTFIIHCPPPVSEELYHISNKFVQEKGIMVDDFMPDMLLPSDLNLSAKFAAQMRRQLIRHTGAILIKGFDVNRMGGEGHPLLEDTCKFLYYMLCRLIGTVEEGSRGRLFDVKSSGLSHKADNVLFSVTDGEASWHTDGTSKDKVFDVVGLLCIRPAAKGGEFAVANACNAFCGLDTHMPRFIMYELMRPLPRDVIEKGKGKGAAAEDFVSNLARSKEMLQLRILRNAFPIFEVAKDDSGCLEVDRRMRFRYMRFWVESGHQKAGLRVSPMLRLAMDFLDHELEQFCCFKAPLEAGDIVMCNNHLIAHARESFKDGKRPRHKVRAWIQIQVADLLDEVKESEGHHLSMITAKSDISGFRRLNRAEAVRGLSDEKPADKDQGQPAVAVEDIKIAATPVPVEGLK